MFADNFAAAPAEDITRADGSKRPLFSKDIDCIYLVYTYNDDIDVDSYVKKLLQSSSSDLLSPEDMDTLEISLSCTTEHLCETEPNYFHNIFFEQLTEGLQSTDEENFCFLRETGKATDPVSLKRCKKKREELKEAVRRQGMTLPDPRKWLAKGTDWRRTKSNSDSGHQSLSCAEVEMPASLPNLQSTDSDFAIYAFKQPSSDAYAALIVCVRHQKSINSIRMGLEEESMEEEADVSLVTAKFMDEKGKGELPHFEFEKVQVRRGISDCELREMVVRHVNHQAARLKLKSTYEATRIVIITSKESSIGKKAIQMFPEPDHAKLAELCSKCGASSSDPIQWYAQLVKDLLEQEEITLGVSLRGTKSKKSPASGIAIADLVHGPQKKVAERILHRALYVLNTTLDDIKSRFTNMRFVILTPVFTSLRDQTAERIGEMSLAEDLRASVFTHTKHSRHYFQAFKEYALAHKDHLCVLVADECHAAIKKSTDLHYGARDSFVNDEQLVNAENVLILLVSATPENLLTSASRIPELKIMSEPDGSAIRKTKDGVEELHVVEWFHPSECRDGRPITQYRRLESIVSAVPSAAHQDTGIGLEQRLICHQYVRPGLWLEELCHLVSKHQAGVP